MLEFERNTNTEFLILFTQNRIPKEFGTIKSGYKNVYTNIDVQG